MKRHQISLTLKLTYTDNLTLQGPRKRQQPIKNMLKAKIPFKNKLAIYTKKMIS